MAVESKNAAIGRLVDTEKGIVSREIFVNEEIYQRELEQVFTRAWLFVGHESQIPKPGDFFRVRYGRRVGYSLPGPGKPAACVPELLPASGDESVPL